MRYLNNIRPFYDDQQMIVQSGVIPVAGDMKRYQCSRGRVSHCPSLTGICLHNKLLWSLNKPAHQKQKIVIVCPLMNYSMIDEA